MTNDRYISRFNRLVEAQRGLGDKDEWKFWFRIEKSVECDSERALLVIQKLMKSSDVNPDDMVGDCFHMVMIFSRALLCENIRHTVTIGNVRVKGELYFSNSTKESIENDINVGFLDGKTVNAHAWITLEDGTIIDLTILSSLARKEKRKTIKRNKAIYSSKDSLRCDIEHIPYHLGIEYIIRVVYRRGDLIFVDWLALFEVMSSSQ